MDIELLLGYIAVGFGFLIFVLLVAYFWMRGIAKEKMKEKERVRSDDVNADYEY